MNLTTIPLAIQSQFSIHKLDRFPLLKHLYFGLTCLPFAFLPLLYILRLRQKNDQVQKTNKRLLEAVEEKDQLLREIHHRVKNNLQVISSLLSLQTKYVKDKHAISALNEGQNRVESMVLIHQNLYRQDDISGVSMKDYIPRLANSIFDSYNIQGDEIKIEYELDDITLDVATVIPIGLVLNELISNALKYAFPDRKRGMLNVSLSINCNNLILSVSDNGIGLNQAEYVKGFGSKLIAAFARKLEGDLKINGEDGTCVEILIKNFKCA